MSSAPAEQTKQLLVRARFVLREKAVERTKLFDGSTFIWCVECGSRSDDTHAKDCSIGQLLADISEALS